MDRQAFTMGGVTYTTSLDYDDSGQLIEYTYPDGTSVERTYTDRGQLHQLKFAGSTIDTRVYDDGGRMTSSTYLSGVAESRTYNNDNTLDEISFTGASIGTYSYGWDANKNKTSETITGTMSNYGFTVGTSGYDDEDRLVNWERDDTNLDQSWNLSLVGDWDSYTENTAVQNRTHGDTHELLTVGSSSVTHDIKGNMTLIPAVIRPDGNDLALDWDFENRMTAADIGNDGTDEVTYKWDALGRRVYRDDGTSAFVYVQVGQQTIADYGYSMAATSPKYNYVYASYIDEPVMREEPAASEEIFFHRNQQMSVIALTDDAGVILERYAYDAYGEPVFLNGSGAVMAGSAEDNRYTYTGREWDEDLALYHFRARMYDSEAGRFCSRDRIGYYDGASLYKNYFGLSLVDPTGLETIGFEFNAFIGKGRGERPGAGMWWLREPGHIGVRVPEFSSDARGFGQVGTSRLFTTGSVESCAIGFQTPHAANNVGESHRRTPNGYMWVYENGRRRIVYLWKYHSKTATLDVDEVDGSFGRMPCRSEVTFRASAGYPFVMGSPNIDYEITFTFTVVGSDRVQVDVSGWHDQFPDYEAILKVGGTRSVIYKRRSPDMGPGILNLNSTTGASGSTVINVKTPACCPGTCGS